MKILVADDSKTIRGMLALSLNKLGHQVLEATNGEQAIELFKKNRPDLIILDVIMEGMDGFQCARNIRNINSQDWIPIIFLSGAVDDENIARGIEAGGDDYLTKPYSEITLAAKIQAMQRIANMRESLFELTNKLRALSSTDALTGIHNRLQFDTVIKEKISYAKRYHTTIALLFIDLDKFKIINDTLGHYIGDLLLIEVASRLKSCVRLEDFISRIGGDEFAIVLNNVNTKEIASSIANKIIYSIQVPYNIAGHIINISSSIGIACYPSEESSEKNLVQNADVAMYHAKVSGRNNYQFYTKELGTEHNKQNRIKEALSGAVERNELLLTYHPIYCLRTNQIDRVEVLTCWNSKEFGVLEAEHFIPLAEELEIMDEIGDWVLKKACEQLNRWNKDGYKKIKLCVNLSPSQLSNNELPNNIKRTIDDSGVPPEFLELEVTETSTLIYSRQAESIINRIYQIGVNISLDDFGTGYSSLTHLKQLPIKTVKIDKSFVRDITTASVDNKIIRSVIELGNELNFDVIAEGIESEEQLKCLTDSNCKFGQGYYFTKPLTAELLTELLKKKSKEFTK